MTRKQINTEFCEEQVLKKCFDCLVVLGLERASMRDFCEVTGLSTSSLYHRFENKDEIVIKAACLGLSNVTKELFWVASTKLTNSKELSNAVIKNVDLRKNRVRLIYQIATSPKYGDLFREKTQHIADVYMIYAEMIANHLRCSTNVLIPYVYLFVATVREYIIWEDKTKTELELNTIYSDVMKRIAQ